MRESRWIGLGFAIPVVVAGAVWAGKQQQPGSQQQPGTQQPGTRPTGSRQPAQQPGTQPPGTQQPGSQMGAQQPMQMPNLQPGVKAMTDVKLGGVAGMPTCTQVGIEAGDPKTSAFVGIAKMKQNCVIPAHWHTANEHVMFIDGTARMEMKDMGKPMTARAGAYAAMPAKQVHQLTCTSRACTMFVMSDGPFDIHYVDPQGNEMSPEDALKVHKEMSATPTAMK